MSSKHAVFLDTEVFKGPWFIQGKIPDVQTHFKSTKTFQYHPLSVKKGFVKRRSFTLNSNELGLGIIALKKKEFLTREIERGYPQELVETILAEVRFESRRTALQNKPKTSKKILPFVTTFSPRKKILMKHWHLITGNNTHAQIYPNVPVLAYRKEKSLKVSLVRAKIPPV